TRRESADQCDSAGRLYGSPHRLQSGGDLCTTRRVPRGHTLARGCCAYRFAVLSVVRARPVARPAEKRARVSTGSRKARELLADVVGTIQIRANLIFARFLRQL